MCLSVSFSRLAWAYSQACLEKLQEREWELQGNLRPRLRTVKHSLLQHSIGQSKYKAEPRFKECRNRLCFLHKKSYKVTLNKDGYRKYLFFSFCVIDVPHV